MLQGKACLKAAKQLHDIQAVNGQRGGTSARMRPVRSSCRRRRCLSSSTCQCVPQCTSFACCVRYSIQAVADMLCRALGAQLGTCCMSFRQCENSGVSSSLLQLAKT